MLLCDVLLLDRYDIQGIAALIDIIDNLVTDSSPFTIVRQITICCILHVLPGFTIALLRTSFILCKHQSLMKQISKLACFSQIHLPSSASNNRFGYVIQYDFLIFRILGYFFDESFPILQPILLNSDYLLSYHT